MLQQVISKIRPMLEETQPRLPVESAAAIEQVLRDIDNLNHFINREIDILEIDDDLNATDKKRAKRKIFERAKRKLEIFNAKRDYSALREQLETKLKNESEKKEHSILKFLQEREIRDRLSGMTEAQILSHFGDSLFEGSNMQLLDAILNAPPGFEILPEDILNNLRVVRAKKMNPKIANKIETALELNSTISQIFTLVKEELDDLRGRELPVFLNSKD